MAQIFLPHDVHPLMAADKAGVHLVLLVHEVHGNDIRLRLFHEVQNGVIPADQTFPRRQEHDFSPLDQSGDFRDGGAVVNLPALELIIELLDQLLIIQHLVLRRNRLNDFFNILHGQSLPVDEIGGVVGVAHMTGRNMIGHGVAPLVFFANGGNILVVNPHNHAHVVPGSDISVDILRNQLCGQVSRASAHAVYRGVQDQRPLGLDFAQDLSVGKGELEVVVTVEADVNSRLHIFVDYIKPV